MGKKWQRYANLNFYSLKLAIKLPILSEHVIRGGS